MAVEMSGSVATISFGTGRRSNALGLADWTELERVTSALAGLLSLRALVLRGRGGTFCSGFDLREWDGASGTDVSRSFEVMESALQAIEDLPVPTVAVVEGFATGGGCQLALACDLQLMTSSARIGMPIARLGLLVPATFANRMSLRIGPSRSKDLLYGGRLLTAEEAYGIGLVSTVVSDDAAEPALSEVLAAWNGLSAASLRASKAAVDHGLRPVTQHARTTTQGPASDPEEFDGRVRWFLNRKRVPGK
ncbi:enoyl-CoA hydratase/isomerase family protein [bacterium RCC_150]